MILLQGAGSPSAFSSFADVLAVVTTFGGGVFAIYRVWRRGYEGGSVDKAPPFAPAPPPSGTIAGPSYEGVHGIDERLALLERWIEEAEQRGSAKTGSGEALSLEVVRDALANLRFLENGGVLAGRYELERVVGDGRFTQVWRARDVQTGRAVAVRFLRNAFRDDRSVVRRFFDGTSVIEDVRATCIPPIRQISAGAATDAPGHASTRLLYYVTDFVEGETLEAAVAQGRLTRGELLHDLVHLGRCLVEIHGNGFVLGSLSPDSIIIDPTGQFRLVGLNTIARVGDASGNPHSGSLSHTAPELFTPDRPITPAADVYAFARLALYVFRGGELRDPFTESNAEAVELSHAPLAVRRTLRSATDVNPEARPSMEDLLGAVRVAASRGDDGDATFRELLDNAPIVGQSLRHACIGTLVAMLTIRPLMAAGSAGPLLYLSVNPVVGAFHGFIGSLVWGLTITGAFWLYLIARNQDRWDWLRAAVLCGLGGFVGGIVCAVPSVLVTSSSTLRDLGWLVSGGDVPVFRRLAESMISQGGGPSTGMFFSYPLTGALTGIGLGLGLNWGLNELAARGTPGVTPIPTKSRWREESDVGASLRFVLGSPWLHLFLLTPVLFSWVAPQLMHPAPPPPAGIAEFVARPLWARSAGEGFVHYVGALGLAVGFFLGIARKETGGTHGRAGR